MKKAYFGFLFVGFMALGLGGCSLLGSPEAETPPATETHGEVTNAMPADDSQAEEMVVEGDADGSDEMENKDTQENADNEDAATEAMTYTIGSDANASYTVQKKWFNKPTEKVTGTTGDVTGTINVNAEKTNVTLSAVVQTTFASGNGKRDTDVAKLLGDTVTVRGESLSLPASFSSAESATQNMPLMLTMNGVTKSVPFNVTLKNGEVVSASGSATISSDDFNLDLPSIANVYTVDKSIMIAFSINAAN